MLVSILSRQALRGASLTSPKQLRQAIDNFVSAYNEKAGPLERKKRLSSNLPLNAVECPEVA